MHLTIQNDRQSESLSTQMVILAGHRQLTGRYFFALRARYSSCLWQGAREKFKTGTTCNGQKLIIII